MYISIILMHKNIDKLMIMIIMEKIKIHFESFKVLLFDITKYLQFDYTIFPVKVLNFNIIGILF